MVILGVRVTTPLPDCRLPSLPHSLSPCTAPLRALSPLQSHLTLGKEFPNFSSDTSQGPIDFHEWLGGCVWQAVVMSQLISSLFHGSQRTCPLTACLGRRPPPPFPGPLPSPSSSPC